MKYLWSDEKKLKNVFDSPKKRVIFLDFDGTLVSIASTPDAVKLDPQVKKVLQDLSANPQNLLVVISGRSWAQLQTHVRLRNAVLAGNHGLEIRGRGLTLPPKARRARKLRSFIERMAQKFRMAFHVYPGVLVEDKKYTLSVHFRNVPEPQKPVFKELIRFFKQKYGHFPVIWTQGKKVMEIRPSVSWNKGDTVEYLMKKNPGAVPIAIGDDRTDEDMFRALKRLHGITIRVGHLKSSLADYYLSSPHDVKMFLQKLCA